ncbi:hypothetical protein [Micromonospora aurantiaca (nom. illeg.)]|uniref:hypothetical protein n=1 Tax=Micromonospora aurantiaca (nom. illeg.) TaxID=47850 RepID=UPI0037A77E93
MSGASDSTVRYQARTTAERARRRLHMVAFPYRETYELVGDEPEQCHDGQSYAGGGGDEAAAGLVDMPLRS